MVPTWFTLSFLDLREDLEVAVERGKMGIALYFGLEHCPYCERMLHENLVEPDIRQYLSDHFDVIALHRVSTTMDYVLTRAYKAFPTYRRYRAGNVE